MSTLARMGYFFTFLGIGLIALFVLSDVYQDMVLSFLAFGGASLALGIFCFVVAPKKKPTESERFRSVRRTFGKKPKK